MTVKKDTKRKNVFRTILNLLKRIFGNKKKLIITVILTAVIIGAAVFIIKADYLVHVSPGQRGVVFNRFGGGISDRILGEGTHIIVPGFQTVYNAKISRQSAHIERITADSKEFQDAALWLNVEFRIDENALPRLFRMFGVISSENLIDRYIIPNTNEVTKNIIINYPIGEILVKQQEIKDKIIEELKKVLFEYFIIVIDVDIENIRLAPAFREIMASIEFAEFERKNAELQMEIARRDAEQRILAAETSKREKILQAEAEAEYNRLISSQAINDVMLEYKKLENSRAAIDRWNGQLPQGLGDVSSWPF